MSNLFKFVPDEELTSHENLNEFVLMCRDKLTVFGADLDWHSDAWRGIVNFTKKGVNTRGYDESQLLDSAIIPFAKAYFRYQQGHNPDTQKLAMKAIRCIEVALLEIKGCADITQTDLSVMDEAGRVAGSYGGSRYAAGNSLVKLVEFLNESRIIAAPILWKNPIRKPKEIGCTDAEGKKKRDEKMPSVVALDAMAEMFFNDLQDSRDRFTSSIFALCICAPSRISEVQDLHLNCLHWEVDGKGVERLGLRFYAGKNYGAHIKWIPTALVQVAQEAVRRLTELSASGRTLARWLEEHPDKFYRHDGCPDVGEDDPLTATQACLALGLAPGIHPSGSLIAGMRSYEPFRAFYDANGYMTLRFLNGFVHSKLPNGWPWLNKKRHIKYSHALCCFRQSELRADFTPRPIIIWTPSKSTFSNDISYSEGQPRTIWERNRYKNVDGSPISMTSHQIRHYLNTVAQRGDMGQIAIAKWSGRANIHQNGTYNHMTDEEHVVMAREAGIGTALGKIRQNLPVTVADLEAAGDAIAHVTIFGFCLHDYSMLPCQKYRDCLNCTEHVCVKGEIVKLERLKAHRDAIRVQLAKAQRANDEGIYGADRWSQHQFKTLERADQLIGIHEADDTPDGTLIRLSSDQEFSPLKRAIAAKSAPLGLVPPSEAEPTINELRAVLGI